MSDPLSSLLGNINQPNMFGQRQEPPIVDFNSLSKPTKQSNGGGFGSKLVGKELKGFMMIEVGTYNTMARRTFQTNLTNEVVSGINDVYKNKPMSKITAGEVAGVCNQFFTISPVVESLVDITNGWKEKRHSFVLAIDVVTPMQTIRKIVSGYTESAFGITTNGLTGSVAPDLNFYVNSIVDLGIVTTHVNGSSYSGGTIKNNVQVITSDYSAFNSNENINLVTPHSILEGIEMAEYMQTAENSTIISADSIASNKGTLVKRDYVIPTKSLTGVLGEYTDALLRSTPSMSECEIFGSAANMLSPTSGMQDHFLSKLLDETGQVKVFDYTQLLSWFPNADDILTVIKTNPTNGLLANSGNSASWTDTTISAQFAYLLAQAVPAILLSFGVSNFSFSMTNMTVGGVGIVYTPNSAPQGFFDKGDSNAILRAIEGIRSRLVAEVINDFTYRGELPFSLTINYGIGVDMMIRTKIGSDPEQDYYYPSFADADLTPAITKSMGQQSKIIGDMKDLITYLPHPKELSSSSFLLGGIETPHRNSGKNDPFSSLMI